MSNGSLLQGRSLAAISLLFISASVCLAQQTSDQSTYIEVTWLKVKQDKVAEFGQMASRIADANRRAKGDHWIAYVDMYGKDNNVWMAALRSSLTDVEPGMNKFMGAVKEFMGYSPERFMAEASKTTDSSGTELWRQRFDLSWNIKDAADWSERVAKAKYMAVVTIRVKPGHILDAAKQIEMVRDATLTRGDGTSGAVAQLVMGGDPATFYIRIPFESLADLEKMPSPRTVLGDEAYRKYSEMAAQNYLSLDYSFRRAVTEWSNPPASFAEANPAMWKVKPVVSAKAKATAMNSKTPKPGGQ